MLCRVSVVGDELAARPSLAWRPHLAAGDVVVADVDRPTRITPLQAASMLVCDTRFGHVCFSSNTRGVPYHIVNMSSTSALSHTHAHARPSRVTRGVGPLSSASARPASQQRLRTSCGGLSLSPPRVRERVTTSKEGLRPRTTCAYWHCDWYSRYHSRYSRYCRYLYWRRKNIACWQVLRDLVILSN